MNSCSESKKPSDSTAPTPTRSCSTPAEPARSSQSVATEVGKLSWLPPKLVGPWEGVIHSGNTLIAHFVLAFVGKDLLHCSKVMYRKLFKPGALQIIRDLDSGEWRAFDPTSDFGRDLECREAGPIVPARLIKSISWEDKKEEVARTAKLNDGSECTFFSGEGEPPQGWDLDIAWLDEEIAHPKWYSEMVPRLVDRGGTLFWSFTPQIGSPAAYDLMGIADSTADDPTAPVQKFFFNIDTNTYISDLHRRQFKEDMSHDEEEYRVRVEGKSALEGQRVYAEFQSDGIHKSEVFLIPEDWTRYVFVDPGRQVAAALFLAVAPPSHGFSKHTAVIYDEIYLKKANAQTFAACVKQHCGEQWIQDWTIDGHAARCHEIGSGKDVESQYREAFIEAGLESNNFRGFQWGGDDLDAGILAVKGELALKGGVPGFVFMTERLRWLTWEMKRYANKKISKVNIVTDKPEKKHDHAVDCLRYAAQHPLRYITPPKSKKAPKKSWTEKYLKAKKQRAVKEKGGTEGVRVF